MFIPEKLDDMTPEEKLETIDALNAIEDAHISEFDTIMNRINKGVEFRTSQILEHVALKRKILEDDIDFQEKLGDRMLNSMAKIDAASQNRGNSPVSGIVAGVASVANAAIDASATGNPVALDASNTLEYF